MFSGPLFSHADDDRPAQLFVEDESVGRRVPVELRMSGRYVIAVPVDVPEFEEPPLGSGVDPAGGDVPDVRRAPIDPDDFSRREPDPAGAPPR